MKFSEEKDPASQNLDEELNEWEEERRQNEEYKGLLFPGTERWISKPGNMKRLIIASFVSLFILIIGVYGYQKFNAWRAGKLIQESWNAFTIGDSEIGNRLLAEALNLAPSSTPVLHALEMHRAKTGDKNSLQNLLHRMDLGASDPDELLGIAEIEVNTPGQMIFSKALARLPVNITSGQSLRLNLVEAASLAQKGNVSDAAAYCLSKAVSAEPELAARLNAQGALYLLSCNDEAASQRAATLLLNVAKSKTAVSIQSWRILAKMILFSPPNAINAISPEEAQEISALFPSLHDEALLDQFTDADIAIHLHPQRREEIADRLVSSHRTGERQTLLDLAWWLNARGFYSQVMALAGSDRPLNDTDWLLATLYAQDAEGKWGDVDAMLDSSAAEGIPDAMRYLILARSSMTKGDQAGAEEAWRNVDGSLYLETSSTLINLARFEEHVGAWPHARRTYTEMVTRDETKVDGLKALIRLAPPNESAQSLIPLYKELIQIAPELQGAKEDLTYLKLLAKEDIPKDIADAKELLDAHPDSLECVSIAALACLRSGDNRSALKIYNGKQVDWANAPASWKVIRSAVLRASGDDSSADLLASTIDQSKLRPESLDLLLGN